MSNLVTLSSTLAKRLGMDNAAETLEVLKATAFKTKAGDPPATDAQLTSLLIVAGQYGLNPWTREIYAYPDKQNGIVPVVGVDGWSRIINEHPQMNGIEFAYSEKIIQHKGKTAHEWIDCIITRKDREKPIIIREYFDEVCRTTNFVTPWDSHPKRMHRHKTLIQAARIAFGFAGIYDEDEAARIIEKDIGGGTTEQPSYAVGERKEPQDQQPNQPEQKTQEGQFIPADSVMPNQLNMIRKKLEGAGKTEMDLCKQFQIDAAESLPKASVNKALDWIAGK